MAKRAAAKPKVKKKTDENEPVEIPTDPARFERDDDPISEVEMAKKQADEMAGDEEPGGTVEVPDHDSVDEWASALGVERSPDSPVRGSAEILDERDRRRGGPDPEKQRRSI